MSYVNRYQKGSSYPQVEKDREANARGKSREDSRSESTRKPVELGKEYDVEILERSRREDGIARIDNFVIFVRKATVGQKARIKIESVSQSFAIASIVPNVEDQATSALQPSDSKA
ncbi:MAG: TRAM domain-containing protein [Nitrososphaerales archaeon]